MKKSAQPLVSTFSVHRFIRSWSISLYTGMQVFRLNASRDSTCL